LVTGTDRTAKGEYAFLADEPFMAHGEHELEAGTVLLVVDHEKDGYVLIVTPWGLEPWTVQASHPAFPRWFNTAKQTLSLCDEIDDALSASARERAQRILSNVTHQVKASSLRGQVGRLFKNKAREWIDTLRIDTIDKPTDFTALGEIFVDLVEGLDRAGQLEALVRSYGTDWHYIADFFGNREVATRIRAFAG
jgi:hypothetical protein